MASIPLPQWIQDHPDGPGPFGASHIQDTTIDIGTTSASGYSIPLHAAVDTDQELLGFGLINGQTITLHTNSHWKFDIQLCGSAGTGSTSIFSTIPSTRSATLTARVPKLASADQNKVLPYGEAVKLVLTKTGAPAALKNARLTLRYRRKM